MNRTEMTDEQLAAAAQSDSAAFDELAVRYLPTVAARAAGFSGDGCSLGSEDLGQEGFIGLMGAVRSYDPSLSVPFRGSKTETHALSGFRFLWFAVIGGLICKESLPVYQIDRFVGHNRYFPSLVSLSLFYPSLHRYTSLIRTELFNFLRKSG